MSKWLFYIVIIQLNFLFTTQVYSQNKVDSLDHVLNSNELSKEDLINLLVGVCRNITDSKKLLEYSDRLIIEASLQKNGQALYQGHLFRGHAEMRSGKIHDAIEAYIIGSHIADSINYPIGKADALADIGDAYASIKDYEKASKYLKSAEQIFEAEDVTSSLAAVTINLGYFYYLMDKLDLAKITLEKAEKSSLLIENPVYLSYAQSNLALVLAKADNFNLANEKMNSALKIMKDAGDEYGIADCLVLYGAILLEKNHIKDAIDKSLAGIEIAKANGFKEQIQNGSLCLSKAYEKINDFKKAYKYQTDYYANRDSLINADLIRKLADQRTEFEVGQKQAEVDLLTAEKKIQQLMLFAAIAFAVVFIVLASIIYKYYRTRNRVAKILEIKKQELERVNTTKDKFFSIISHDLRGPVASFFGISRMIKFLVKSKETDQLLEIADDIDQSVERLSNLLDNLLNWAMQQQGHVPNIPEKLDFKYLAMDLAATFKTMADSKKIRLNVEVEDTVFVWADRNMTMTIFRNLINNALKFTPEGGSVTLFASEKEGLVTSGVQDTGVGIPKEKLESLFTLGDKKSTYGTSGEKGLGLGLQLVYEFIELNKGEIIVNSENGKGTTFTVKLQAFNREIIDLPVSKN